MNKISVLILTKNEEKDINECLNSVSWADEIVVVDDFSEDKTTETINKRDCEIKIYQRHLDGDFAGQRNFALVQATGNWVLYIDADERVSPKLAENIKRQSEDKEISAFKIRRKNYYYGKHEWPFIEGTLRLFRKDKLKGWQGRLHESPVFEGKEGEIEGFLLHFTHQNLRTMLENTIEWSAIESDLRFKASHPKITWWRLPRVMLTEFFNYYVGQGGWKAGTVGLMESIYQSFSIFITYARLWEEQNVNRNL